MSSPIIHLNEMINSPKWDKFISSIKRDSIFDDEDEPYGYFFCVASTVYWFHFHKSRTFSSQTLEMLSTSLAIRIENVTECDKHDHTHLMKYFFDDGPQSHCALQLNENDWSIRLVQSLNNCNYSYLQGWECDFYGTKTDHGDFDRMQKVISGTSFSNPTDAYAYHGAPDILLHKQGDDSSFVIAKGSGSLDTNVRVVENSRQTLSVFQIRDVCVPQKLGEVIAQVHFVVSAQLLRFGLKGSFPSAITAKGLLIDKNSGGYHVEVTAQIDEHCNTVPMLVVLKRQKILGSLREGLLCEHIKKLIST